MTGYLTINGPPVCDPKFKVEPTLMHQPMICRNVKVHAWKENITQFEERKGDMVRRGKKCDYTPSWMNEKQCPSSNDFQDKLKKNIPPSVHAETFYCKFLACGEKFTFDPQDLLKYVTKTYHNCKLRQDFYPLPDEAGDWKMMVGGAGL